MEIYKIFGIDAAMVAIETNLEQVISGSANGVIQANIKIISRLMTFTGRPCALTFSGLVNAKVSALKLSLFERPLTSFINAAVKGHEDSLQGLSESTMVGSKIKVGTGGSFRLYTIGMTPRILSQVVQRSPTFLVPDISQSVDDTIFIRKILSQVVIDIQKAVRVTKRIRKSTTDNVSKKQKPDIKISSQLECQKPPLLNVFGHFALGDDLFTPSSPTITDLSTLT